MKKNHVCIICGKEFLPKRYDSKICSKECLKNFKSRKHKIENKEYVCEICGKEFIRKSSYQRTCSRECGDKLRLYNYTIKEKKPKPIYVSRKKFHKKICVVCNKEFETYSKRQICCSKECLLIRHKKPLKEVNNICVWCGKEFKSNRIGKFCSRSCSTKCRDTNTLHNRPYKINNSKQNKVFRNLIGERDNWICNICGNIVDKELKYPNPMSASLDHIIPLSKGGEHNENNVHISHLYCNCVVKKDNI